jgi:hypothetical protein
MRRFAYRAVRRFVALDRCGEVFVGCHQVVPHGHLGRISQPVGNDLQRISSTNSVSRLARKLWNSLGHGFRPDRLTIRSTCVRRLAFIQPPGRMEITW